MYSILKDMRQRGLDPWLDGEGYIHISYMPDSAYFAYLKQNKHLALAEIRIEESTGLRLDGLRLAV